MLISIPMRNELLRRVFPGESEMAGFMRSRDWNAGEPGPLDAWPTALRNAIAICLSSQLAAYVVWGPKQIVFYNDPGLKLLGPEKHPSVFARSGLDAFGEAWPTLARLVEETLHGTPGRWERVEIRQTLAATVACIPIIGDAGGVDGVLCTCIELVPPAAAARESDADRVTAPASGVKSRILLIDGDHATQAEIRQLLQSEYIVEAVIDGHTAIEIARRNPPAAVLMDLSVAGIGGIELVRALRAEPLTGHMPLMIISARTAEDTRVEALRAGADDYVAKPFSGRELVARLRTQIHLAHARMEIGAVRAAARAQDDLLSLLGHELRNPLSALSSTVQALLIHASSPEMELMERAVRQLTRLVDDLLDVSRLSRGKIGLERFHVEVAHVVDDAIDRVQPLLTERGTQVFVRVPRSGLAVDCDRRRMAQAIANVLSNACKFSAAGASVSLQATRVAERVQIRIKDTGSGIAPARLSTVFDAFNHGRDSAGLGIGLAIARSLIELHHGTITIASHGVGHGTECVIELPFQLTDASAKPGRMAKRSRKRVLLVEDNHDTALALKRGLEELGYQVAIAHDGPVALTVARSFQPDVALLDIGLPVMDGWELARRLREMRVPSRELHFVAVTARDQDADKQRSHEAGFADHLVKPIDLAKLERVVENLPPTTG